MTTKGKSPDGKNIITIPFEFEPRVYQKQIFAAFDVGFKRALVIYHRRAG